MHRLCLITLAAIALPAQTQTTIRTETRVVQIDVDVRDSHGRPVTGLTRDDFTILDSGRPRSIQIFQVEGSGAPPAAASPIAMLPPNVFTNRIPPPRPGHATIILLDTINNYWDDVAVARLRMLKMTDKLQSDERIAIYAAATRPAGILVIQDFTTDRARLRRTIEGYRPPPIEPFPVRPPPTTPAEQEFIRRRAVTDTTAAFRMLAEHLGKLPGRKSILWVTSGLPPKQLRDMPDPFDHAADALNEANVAVHTLDDDGVGGFRRRWGRVAADTLRELSDRTGGTVYEGRNDLENMLRESIESPRIIYTLGFYVPDAQRDDKFHPLAVKVDRPGVILSYRKGYVAGAAPDVKPPRKREPLDNDLLDPGDSTGIFITAQVVRGPAPRLGLRLGLAQLSLRQQGSDWSGKVEQLFVQTNASGRILARVAAAKEFRISDRLRLQFATDGLPLQQDLKLMDDASRLLVVIRDSESGRTGSLSIRLDELR